MRTKIEMIAEYLQDNRQSGHTRAIMKGAENFTPRPMDEEDQCPGTQQKLTILVSTEALAETLKGTYKLPEGVTLRSVYEPDLEGVEGALVLDNSAVIELAKEVEEMRKRLWWESRHPFKAWWKRVKEKLQQLDVDHLGKQSLTS